MPEGPTLLIASEEAQRFVGRKVLRVEGNSRAIDIGRMKGKVLREVRTWGKHFLFRFDGFALRVHFMLFGSYRINERKENANVRLGLGFSGGEELNFYASSVQYIDEPLDERYDWSADVLSPTWDPAPRGRSSSPRPRAWSATRCSTRRCSPGSATSSRTRCCSASTCIRSVR
jgi:endonuclease-8